MVQSGACSLVGQAVVQLARAKGATTVSVVAPSPDEEDMVALLKSLGGDVVVVERGGRRFGVVVDGVTWCCRGVWGL